MMRGFSGGKHDHHEGRGKLGLQIFVQTAHHSASLRLRSFSSLFPVFITSPALATKTAEYFGTRAVFFHFILFTAVLNINAHLPPWLFLTAFNELVLCCCARARAWQ